MLFRASPGDPSWEALLEASGSPPRPASTGTFQMPNCRLGVPSSLWCQEFTKGVSAKWITRPSKIIVSRRYPKSEPIIPEGAGHCWPHQKTSWRTLGPR